MYDDLVGIQWKWQAVDEAMTRALLSARVAGPNPTDRAKVGTNRNPLTDRAGIPLTVVAVRANRTDMKLLAAILCRAVVALPDGAQHLCLDAGYGYPVCRQELQQHGYQAHIRPKGAPLRHQPGEPGHPARRWVVERTHSWLNRSRRLLVQWEKRTENYLAFVHLACARLVFNKLATVHG